MITNEQKINNIVRLVAEEFSVHEQMLHAVVSSQVGLSKLGIRSIWRTPLAACSQLMMAYLPAKYYRSIIGLSPDKVRHRAQACCKKETRFEVIQSKFKQFIINH